MTDHDRIAHALQTFWEAEAGEPLGELDYTAEVLSQYADALLSTVAAIKADAVRQAADDLLADPHERRSLYARADELELSE